MIRVALAAVLLVAVAGIAFRAIEVGGRERTADRLNAAAERLWRVASLLADRDDPTAASVGGARRIVTVRLPEPSLSAAPVARFVVSGTTDTIGYRLQGGDRRRTHGETDLETAAGGVVLRGPGSHRLVLTLVGNATPRVVVERAEGNGTAGTGPPRDGRTDVAA